ncbi:unnamed protein product [Darwinula stevensoni]|uniref:Nucleoporin SEH1 n=1 Tax=Darwinula stevensoni TaxID=69355 RepID=A0A7R9AAE5_9CRUS|nr:unnamed protein product [Darwinula stevensoni]CAG0898372.1 unnamed protein product [Darwinula stevensoni]
MGASGVQRHLSEEKELKLLQRKERERFERECLRARNTGSHRMLLSSHSVECNSSSIVFARTISADHKDLVHDVAFDFYGRRVATCSSDQTVKVFNLGDDNSWHCTASWKAHSGSVWKVTWAHPEFGQVLATCSFDRTATVWEEIVTSASSTQQAHPTHWVKRTSLVDSRTSVNDVKFGPKHLGLQLATCSADGIVRIYEAPDVMNLSQWSLQHEINCKLQCSCISWTPLKTWSSPPMIAVGSDEPNLTAGPKTFIYEFQCTDSPQWVRVDSLKEVTSPVHDLSFAPCLGRSFHILGIASRDVLLIKIKPLPKETSQASGETSSSKYEITILARLPDHPPTAWRVAWNLTGTILASTGDDGNMRLWKANFDGRWECISALKGDGSRLNEAPAPPLPAQSSGTSLSDIGSMGNAKYYKLGGISHREQVIWH